MYLVFSPWPLRSSIEIDGCISCIWHLLSISEVLHRNWCLSCLDLVLYSWKLNSYTKFDFSLRYIWSSTRKIWGLCRILLWSSSPKVGWAIIQANWSTYTPSLLVQRWFHPSLAFHWFSCSETWNIVYLLSRMAFKNRPSPSPRFTASDVTYSLTEPLNGLLYKKRILWRARHSSIPSRTVFGKDSVWICRWTACNTARTSLEVYLVSFSSIRRTILRRRMMSMSRSASVRRVACRGC